MLIAGVGFVLGATLRTVDRLLMTTEQIERIDSARIQRRGWFQRSQVKDAVALIAEVRKLLGPLSNDEDKKR